MITYLTTRYFGLQNFGSIGGVLFGALMIGTRGESSYRLCYFISGTLTTFWFCLGRVSWPATLMLFCRPYPDLSGDNEGSMS